MTVSSTTYRNDYTGTGITGPYSFTFRIQLAADLQVVTTDPTTSATTTLVYLTDYTISAGGVGARNGGSITLTTALAAGVLLSLVRDPALTQTTNLRNQGRYAPADIEDALDRGVMIAQELGGEMDRSIKVPDTEASIGDLPTATLRANKFLAFDAVGAPTALAVAINTGAATVSVFMAGVINQTTAALAQAAFGISTFVRSLLVAATASAFRILIGVPLSVLDYGAIGNGTADDSVAIQACITAAQIAGGTVLFPAGYSFRAVGLTIRSIYTVNVIADGARLIIKDASAPFVTIYGIRHRWQGGQFQQLTALDQCRAILLTNDNTTKLSRNSTISGVWCYSVHRAFEVLMDTFGTSTGTSYRHTFEDCIAENYTLQSTWAGSFGFKLGGNTPGDAGGNDTHLHRCFSKGYETGYWLQNSESPALLGCIGDANGTLWKVESGSGFTVIGGYYEGNGVIIAFSVSGGAGAVAPYRTWFNNPGFGAYTTLQTGTQLSNAPIMGFDKYGAISTQFPDIGGATMPTTDGITRLYGVNQVGMAIGVARDKMALFRLANSVYQLDVSSLAGTAFFIKHPSDIIGFGDPSALFCAWYGNNGQPYANRFLVPGTLWMDGNNNGRFIKFGTGTPEGNVSGSIGATFHRTDGGAGTSYYVKESGNNTVNGWVAK